MRSSLVRKCQNMRSSNDNNIGKRTSVKATKHNLFDLVEKYGSTSNEIDEDPGMPDVDTPDKADAWEDLSDHVTNAVNHPEKNKTKESKKFASNTPLALHSVVPEADPNAEYYDDANEDFSENLWDSVQDGGEGQPIAGHIIDLFQRGSQSFDPDSSVHKAGIFAGKNKKGLMQAWDHIYGLASDSWDWYSNPDNAPQNS